MDTLGLQDALLGDPKHVLYLSGYRTHRAHRSVLRLSVTGEAVLIAAAEDPAAAADRTLLYEPARQATLWMDQSRQLAPVLQTLLKESTGRIGLDGGSFPVCVLEHVDRPTDISPLLFRLRNRKDQDELELIRRAVHSAEAAYGRAREIIRPGISELEVHGELRKAAVVAAGEELAAFGNDFQCGGPGGPPRPRPARRGEMYILDLGPELAGYHADLSRSFTVGSPPSPAQRRAWECCVEALNLVRERVRPGYSCRALYHEVRELLDRERPGSFFHHLGHGVGLFAHEEPFLNPHWDHRFEEGQVFTAEPGLYGDDLGGGIRLEENFLVTSTGIEQLSGFPLEMGVLHD